MDFNGFRGRAVRVEDADLPRIGSKIGVGEDELHAFMDVESRGSGFDPDGRPKILFEPHVFWRNLPKGKRDEAQRQGLAAPRWGMIKYGRESEQYGKLERALRIDEEAALKACSWGATQILGENYRIVGFDSVRDFVLAMMDDEDNHLEAMVQFLIANGIDDDLKAHRWEMVARVYNGPAYRQHNYHGRMAEAFAKWARIRDTPGQENA